MATPPKPPVRILSEAEIGRALAVEPWRCTMVKKFAAHSTWRTQFGFYFSVPHSCSETDFEAIVADLRKHGRKRNV